MREVQVFPTDIEENAAEGRDEKLESLNASYEQRGVSSENIAFVHAQCAYVTLRASIRSPSKSDQALCHLYVGKSKTILFVVKIYRCDALPTPCFANQSRDLHSCAISFADSCLRSHHVCVRFERRYRFHGLRSVDVS